MERKPRVILFEDDPSINKMLELMFKSLGCEIFTYEDPSLSSLHQSNDCQCSEKEVCADIVITDIDMPNVTGLAFIEKQINKGCKVKNFAILSGSWTDEKIERAEKLGSKVFHKPSFLFEISEWVDMCLEGDWRHQNLSNWFLDG